jgi:hypothetical protein
MASTRFRNCPGDYKIQERNKANAREWVSYDYKTNASILPNAGINMGRIPAYLLSNNQADIDSFLKGTYFNNLEDPRRGFTPRIKKVKEVSYFEKDPVLMPEPLIVERNQRPEIFRR